MMDIEEPLSGEGRIKVFSFFLLMVSTLFFGIIPILIALSGIYIMKKDKSFSAVKSSRKYMKVYLQIVALGIPILASLVYYLEIANYTYDSNHSKIYGADIYSNTFVVAVIGAAFIPAAVSLCMRLLDFLYFQPMEKHKIWIMNNATFSNLESDKIDKEDDSIELMRREKLRLLSVADELKKWNDLLATKAISQTEFDKVKSNLLNQK